MKNKFKLFTGISFGVALCAATSLPLTMTFKDYNHSVVKPIIPIDKFEEPILKDNITFAGTINQLIKSDGRSEDVNSNLNIIFNGNKQVLIENYDKVEQSNFESLQFSSEILDWNNWGQLTFDQWKLQTEPEQKQQNQTINEVEYNKEQMINFTSKNQLKSYLEQNLDSILENSYQNAKLADADFGVNKLGDILIPIIDATPIEAASSKLYSVINTEETEISNKLILKLPSSKIDFTPQIRISGTYVNNDVETEIQPKEITFDCEIINEKAKPITFTSNASSKKIITLKDKGIINNNIELYQSIKDEDVYKALGWLDEDSTLEDHTDGQDMDISLLNEEKIYSDLGINKLTDELFGIKLEFVKGNDSRNVSNQNYDGEYKITIVTIDLSDDYDINLKFKTYEVVSAINQKTNEISPLQLLVPNAYIIDTNLDGNKVMKVTKVFFNNQSFEIGFKTNTKATYSSAKDGIIANLSNDKIFKKFLQKIDESSKQKNISLSNGVTFSFDSVGWNASNDTGFKDTITLIVKLKKGFAFKDAFNLEKSDQSSKTTTIYKYNTNNKTSKVTFGINHSNTKNEAAFFKNINKTVDDVAGSYQTML